jgi:hypothetical protein
MQQNVRLQVNNEIGGLTQLRIENEHLVITLIPELGSKIWQIEYKPIMVPLLWNNPSLRLQPVPSGSDYEQHFVGGWDEIFPNDTPENILGTMQPDHGELWSAAWNYEVVIAHDQSEVTVMLWTHSAACNGRIEKWVSLRRGELKLRVRCRMTNHSDERLPYLWKQHIALHSNEHSRIDLGAKTMYMDVYGGSRTGIVPQFYEWPYAVDKQGHTHNMRTILPGSTKLKEFQYATEMNAGWCALTNTQSGVGFGISFDQKVMPSCWVVASYGAWDGIETVILEPCTGYPLYVEDGIKQGTHQYLEAGESIDTTMIGVVFESRTGVSHIDASGIVTTSDVISHKSAY